MGFLVYPPLEKSEAFQVVNLGDGRFQYVYFLSSDDGSMQPIFTVNVTLPSGNTGRLKEEVEFSVPNPPTTAANALKMMRASIVPEELGTPTGGVTLRGSTNFRTPENWDTVYLPVVNLIKPPVAPMLVVRVETDWYSQESEFRYVLQTGEAIASAHSMPVGQVIFLPREQIILEDCSKEEVEKIRHSKEQFNREKSEHKTTTRYGLEYSLLYHQTSRKLRNATEKQARDEGDVSD